MTEENGKINAGKAPIHILHLEDDPNDAALVKATLEDGGIRCVTTRVQTHDAFVAALEHGGIDLVLSDHTLPQFDGESATAIVRSRWPDLPLILVSGTLGEETAIEALKAGATDYVLKGRLSRLVPAVNRAMLEVGGRARRRQLEAQFIEAQKMEVVGQLAGGIAHDFNNILAVISGYAGLIETALPPESPMLAFAEEIRHATERAAGLSRQLLVFSRKQTIAPVSLDVNAVVRELDKLLRRLIDENIEMTVVLGDRIRRIKADSGYVGQVLMNLVVNARDAMPNGGSLIISTTQVTLDETQVRSQVGATAREFVMLSIRDNGTGMSDEVKAHLFEPFFTTKPLGKGTGLGLAICKTIVQQAGGHIGVRSAPGAGTTFEVCFPCSEGVETVEPPTVRPNLMPRGTETLLVVEDEPAVRQLACTVLEGLGYTVLPAINGQDGLRVARELRSRAIRLVITDVVMPVMGGVVMAEWLRTAYPEVKFLFTSGYSDDAIDTERVVERGDGFLQKPYAAATLAGRVRELLDAPRGHAQA